MSIEENRKRYEESAISVVIERSDKGICQRCYCCSTIQESAPCWECGGFCGDDDDEWGDDGWCDACEGEGEIYFLSCLGSCDDNGDHKRAAK